MLLSEPDNPGGLRERIQVALPATEEEREAVEALEMIEPGDYFVFVRFESDVAPVSEVVPASNRYDYGRFASGPSLPNFVDRRLELTYADERTPEPFDVVRWDLGALVAPDGSGEGLVFPEDVSVGLDPSFEDPAANDDPKKWCLSTESIGSGTALGTPGAPAVCP
jgi:hypothetical protein